MIFETHAHYDDEAFNIDRDEVLASLPKAGIEYVVNISADIKSVEKTLALIDQYSYIYGAIGIHPEAAGEWKDDSYHLLKKKAAHPKVVAVGEIGLDYYWDTVARDTQQQCFKAQIELAKECKLPMVVHSRDAANDTYRILKDCNAEEVGAIIHCFGYGVEQAKKYLNLGFYLGIGGVVTFTNGRVLKEVVEYAPLEQLVLETDCPYLSPVPNRGKRNTSHNLTYVIKEIARIKNIDQEIVIKQTHENAKKFYRL